MGASPPRLTPEQKDAIFELKRQGKSGRDVSRICAAGHNGLKPFQVSAPHANDVYRRIAEEKGELYESTITGLTNSGAIDKLTARLLRITEREVQRAERAQRNGKLDPAKLGKLATVLERLHKLDEARAVPTPPRNADEDGGKGEGAKAGSFAAELAAAADDAPPLADQRVDAPSPPTHGAFAQDRSSDDGAGRSLAGSAAASQGDEAGRMNSATVHAVPTAPPTPIGPETQGAEGQSTDGDRVSGTVTERPVSAEHDQRQPGIHDLAREMGD